jgi:hypothetical protein
MLQSTPPANTAAAAAAGAIDVEELQYALSVMGIDKSPAEVQELMDSVDKDGSGALAGQHAADCRWYLWIYS